jgi:alpha-mannosidase
MDKQVLVVSGYHCDLVWRRTPATQAAIRARQYDAALDMLEQCPVFRFEFDQARLVREYLDTHPERTAQLRRFIAEGRVDVTGGEETIPDTNLVSGEGLVRNILLGRLWFAEKLGMTPAIANMEDAFGLNAQLPQIFAGFGYTAFRDARTPGLDPVLAQDGVLWEGIDGSRIFYLEHHGGISEHTHVCNLPVVYTEEERRKDSLARALQVERPVVFCTYVSEEDLVNDGVVGLVLGWPLPEGTTLRFAQAREVLEAVQRQHRGPQVVRGEFNPNSPGTHITRISLKQAYRGAEWAAVTAEAAATFAALTGTAYPQDTLAELWRTLSAVQFHDAICGCHCDAVYHWLMEHCRSVREEAAVIARSVLTAPQSDGTAPGVALFNPLPQIRREPLRLALPAGMTLTGNDGMPLPAERHGEETLLVATLAPMGVTSRRFVPAEVAEPVVIPGEAAIDQELSVGPYRVTPRHDGVRITQAAWGRTLVDGAFPEVRYRLEDGTLWQERFLGPVFGEEAGTRRLARVETGPVATRLVWEGEIAGDPADDPLPPVWDSWRDGKPVVYADVTRLRWEKELVFYHALERIDATVRLDWEGQNTEILAAFPLQLDLDTTEALYEIPFGMLARKPYYEIPSTSPEAQDAPLHLAKLGGMGAWPALNWVAYRDADWGMALANRGTPSHRLMSGTIEVGVLRSPTTMGSNMNVPPGALEHGPHTFAFALQPFQGSLAESGAYALGPCFNAEPVARLAQVEEELNAGLVQLLAPGVAFSAWKRAERGEGYILRTFETMGQASEGEVALAFTADSVYECDLMETPLRAVDPARLTWRPFEIKTLRIFWGE